MRWLAFLVVAVICVVLHTTIAPRIAVAGISPDWILVLVVFFAIHVRSWDSVAAAWVLGLLADLQSAERFGLLSLDYALVAAAVHLLRDHVFRTHPLAQFSMTLLAGFAVHALLWVYYLLLSGSIGQGWARELSAVAMVALYSAVWAPPVHAGLLRLSRSLGLEVARYSHAGLARPGR